MLNKRLAIIAGATIGGIVVLVTVIVFTYLSLFGASQKGAKPEAFTVSQNASQQDIVNSLYSKGFIKSKLGFNWAMKIEGKGATIKPGSYNISKSSSAWDLVENHLTREPDMKWVTIPEGLRKEQIASIMAKNLGWSDEDQDKFVTNYTALNFDYLEGVYFPDTYLIPVSETPLQTAQRLRVKFNEEFAPYSKEALNQNIKWDTLLKVASIVQREAAGKDDAPVIAGVIWNRLLKGMKLEIDATVQYARDSLTHYGKEPGLYQSTNYKIDGTWWTPIAPTDEKIDSPYNTYLYKGLPPHPIDNPGIDAIKAALYPAETECLYYLHDANKQIHCAKTYEEHQQNIDKYLKNQ